MEYVMEEILTKKMENIMNKKIMQYKCKVLSQTAKPDPLC